MVTLLRRHMLTVIAVLLLTVGSGVSAAMMAPERADAAEAQFAQLGFTVEDLCGLPGGPDHHCPFCHLTPDSPLPTPAELASVLLPFVAWHHAGDLYRSAQARDHAHAPRAPPSLT